MEGGRVGLAWNPPLLLLQLLLLLLQHAVPISQLLQGEARDRE
jgi:hypothetical protein